MDRRAEALGPTGERASQRLRDLRRARGLTLQQLAEKLRALGRPILLSSLSKIEKGQRRVDVDDLVALAVVLDVSPNHLLLPEEDTPDAHVQLAPLHTLDAASAWEWAFRRDLGATNIHEFARRVRNQVAAVHGSMRLPHLGATRVVSHDALYVERELRPLGNLGAPDMATLARPGQRSVILGDPGAGKSTFATRFAHDVASDRLPGAEGMTPFLVAVRDFSASFGAGDRGLVHYLEQLCRAPYNVEPPPEAIDHLLSKGRAVVVLDGLDELIEPNLRRRFVQLIDGFVSQYPSAPVIVTARQIGYADAPLDPELFRVGVLAPLDDDRVRRYAERWFALDEGLPSDERAHLVASFLAESTAVADLRANPLMLGLLCSMYATERYIPRNRATVYERCAVMMFETWDKVRGISTPIGFRGWVRGAVQHLAWQMFAADRGNHFLPRRRIKQILSDYLARKRYEEDDATDAAETFLEFCTGRAWVLTDVGMTSDGEPLYGFTHRTFVEYFAAEHLVRTHPSASQLWEALRPGVLSGAWGTVAQIALQLLDRSVDNGVDDLLRLAIAEQPTDPHQRSLLREFVARAVGDLPVSPKLISEVERFASS